MSYFPYDRSGPFVETWPTNFLAFDILKYGKQYNYSSLLESAYGLEPV